MALPAGPSAEGSALTHRSQMDCTCQPAGTGRAPYGASLRLSRGLSEDTPGGQEPGRDGVPPRLLN